MKKEIKKCQVWRKSENLTQKQNSIVVAERAPARTGIIPVINMSLAWPAPISVRERQKIAKRAGNSAIDIPQIMLSLFEGSVKVNGRKINLPVGISGSMTGVEFKRFAGAYRGDALFIKEGNSMQRVKDGQSVEIVAGNEFKVVPRYRGD